MFAQFFSEIPSGVLGDLFKNKTVVLTGLAVLITTPLLTVMAMFCPENIIFPLLAVSFALEGVGNALLSGADEAFFTKVFVRTGMNSSMAKYEEIGS